MNANAIAAEAPLTGADVAYEESRSSSAKARGTPRLVRNVLALFSGQLVTWTMTLAWTVVVPRVLGPAGLGLVVSAMSVSGVLGIVLGLGTRNYLVREIVIDRPATPALVGTALVLRLAIAPLVGAAAVVYAQLAHYGSEASIVLYLVAASTVMTLIAEPMQAAFQGIERMKYLAYSDIINKSAQSMIGIALALLGLGAIGISADMAAIAVVVIVINLWWTRPFFRIDFRVTSARMLAMVKESIAYWAFGVFGMVYMWIDAIMLSLMTRQEVVGWYGAPTRIFQTLMFLPVLLSTAFLPRLVGAFQEGPAQLLNAARTPLELITVLSAPIAAGTAIVARPMFHYLFGAAYARAVPVMVILAPCIPSIYLNIILAQVLLAAKRQLTWTWVMAGAAVVNPLFNLVLIPATEHRYGNGAIGAAVSLLLTELLMTITGFVLVGRGVFERNAVRRCLLAVLASVDMWAASYLTRSLGTAASLAAGGATLIASAFMLRLVTTQELALARAALARLRARSRAHR